MYGSVWRLRLTVHRDTLTHATSESCDLRRLQLQMYYTVEENAQHSIGEYVRLALAF